MHRFMIILAYLAIWVFPKGDFQKDETESPAKPIPNWTKASLTGSRDYLRINCAGLAETRNDAEQIDCIVELARIEERLGNRNESFNILSSARKMAIRHQLNDRQAIVDAELSLLSYDLGNARQARKYAESALAAADLTSNQLAKGLSEFSMAELLYFEVELENSEAFYLRSIENLRDLYPRGEMDALLGLGYLYLRNDKNHLGLEKFRIALRSAEQHGDLRGKAIALKAIGSSLNNLNRKQEALDHYREAEKLFPRDGIDLTELGILYNGIGSIFEFYADWTQALQSKTEAYKLFSEDNYVYGQLATLSNIGGLSYLAGDIVSARSYLQKATELARRTNNKYHLALSFEEMGNIEFAEKRHKSALKKFRTAIAIYEAIGNRRQNSLVHSKIGQIQLAAGDLNAARASFETAARLGAEVQDSFAMAEVLFQKARLEHLAGRDEAALKMIHESITRAQSIATDVRNAKLQRTYRSTTFDRFQFGVQLQTRAANSKLNGSGPAEPFLIAERSRAYSIHQSLSIADAEGFADADPSAAQKQHDLQKLLNSASDSLTDLLSKKADRSEIEKLDVEIDRLEYQLEEVKADLKQKSPFYSAIKDPPPFDLADFQVNVLKNDEVLLEYFLGKEESYLWLVGKNEFSAYVLPPKDQIEAKVGTLRELLDARKPSEGEKFQDHQARVAEADARFSPLAHELSDTILGQVADKLQGKRLIIVPDGKLHYLPISAIPLPNSASNDPILLTNEVVYQPSAQTYSLLKTLRQNNRNQNTKDILVFADPVFNRDDVRLSGVIVAENTENKHDLSLRFVESLNSLRRLPASGTEAKSIQEVIGGSGIDSLSGFSATRERLMGAQLSDYKVLHFATHGFVDIDRPELSSIVLSRYNESGQQIDESVRMQDIYAMKLNADLVVLSACETGTGKEVKGEGIMGLNTAFLQAGARSVIASLWPVEDNATNLMMREFYDGMGNRGITPSAALRNAQLKLYKDPQFRSPFFWASFTLQGDGNIRPAFSNQNSKWIYASLAAIPLILLALYWYRRRYSALKL